MMVVPDTNGDTHAPMIARGAAEVNRRHPTYFRQTDTTPHNSASRPLFNSFGTLVGV